MLGAIKVVLDSIKTLPSVNMDPLLKPPTFSIFTRIKIADTHTQNRIKVENHRYLNSVLDVDCYGLFCSNPK
jgi:hypothetical protein